MIVLSFDLDPAGRPVIELFASPSAPRIEASHDAGEESPSPVSLKAMVDTGASRSVVHRAVVEALDLDQVGMVWLSTASSGSAPAEAREFVVQLFLAGVTGGMIDSKLRVIEVEDLSGMGVHMLLGRDVLDSCLVVYSGQERRFTFAFG